MVIYDPAFKAIGKKYDPAFKPIGMQRKNEKTPEEINIAARVPPPTKMIGGIPTEEYELPAGQSQDVVERFIEGFGQHPTNEKGGFVGDIADFIGREGLPTAAATWAGIATRDPAIVGLAAAEARALQKAIAKGLGVKSPETAGQIAADIAKTGTFQAAGEKVLGTISAAAKPIYAKIRPGLISLGQQLMRLGPNIRSEISKAVLEDLSLLSRAKTVKDASVQFGETIKKAGMKYGPEATQSVTGNVALGNDAKLKLMNEAIKKAEKGVLDAQEALVAREQVDELLRMSKMGSPEMRAMKRVLTIALNKLDDYIEPLVPGYAQARRDYFEALVANEFRSIFPKTKRGDPDFIRVAAAAAASKLSPFLSPAFSPAVVGGGIRTAAQVEKVAPKVAQTAVKAAIQTQADTEIPSLMDIKKQYGRQAR